MKYRNEYHRQSCEQRNDDNKADNQAKITICIILLIIIFSSIQKF